MTFVGKQNIRSLDEFPIITDFCHKYCTINQIFLKFTYFWRMNASWQNSCIDFFRSDSNEIIIMKFNLMFLMLLPWYELDSFGLHACCAIKIIHWKSTILRSPTLISSCQLRTLFQVLQAVPLLFFSAFESVVLVASTLMQVSVSSYDFWSTISFSPVGNASSKGVLQCLHRSTDLFKCYNSPRYCRISCFRKVSPLFISYFGIIVIVQPFLFSTPEEHDCDWVAFVLS